jgi:hypothetical protein
MLHGAHEKQVAPKFRLSRRATKFRNSHPQMRATSLLGLWFDSPLLATILATGGISIFGDSSL